MVNHRNGKKKSRRKKKNKEAGITRLPFFSYQQQLLFPHPQKNSRRIMIQQQLSPPNPHPSLLFPQNARRIRIQMMLLQHPLPLKNPSPFPLHPHPHPQSRSRSRSHPQFVAVISLMFHSSGNFLITLHHMDKTGRVLPN